MDAALTPEQAKEILEQMAFCIKETEMYRSEGWSDVEILELYQSF